MRECFDEGILQGYCDGELAPEMAERVASHLASCAVCLQAVSEVESENELLSQGLEAEFALSVPTERLRQRVDAAIAGLPSASSSRAPALSAWLQSFADLFKVSPQRAFAFASVAVIVLIASIFAVVQYKNRQAAPTNSEVAQGGSGAVPVTSPEKTPVAVEQPAPPKSTPAPTSQFVQVNYRPRPNPGPRPSSAPDVKLLPGERSYLKTIAALDSTIKADGNKPMRPALQSEYERNLAMVDRAIAATRSAAKSNPNDPDAAEFMFAAYQTKVDFLNQVADSRLSNGRH
jgi:Putative zinc-finger